MSHAVSAMSLRILKFIKLAVMPAYWPDLRLGVAATVEHGAAFRKDVFATVIDVGANKGQFAVFAVHRWPYARLICFEPLPGPRATLARATRGLADIHGCALGSGAGEATMHVASREDSSSLLPLGARQKAIFGMQESGVLQVPVRRLDACLPGPLRRPVLLKIDVQGYELEVLKGANDLLAAIDVIFVEASCVELYEGQALDRDVLQLLTSKGFYLAGRFNNQRYQGALVQADLLFRRPGADSARASLTARSGKAGSE